jgi:hypothetical protein
MAPPPPQSSASDSESDSDCDESQYINYFRTTLTTCIVTGDPWYRARAAYELSATVWSKLAPFELTVPISPHASEQQTFWIDTTGWSSVPDVLNYKLSATVGTLGHLMMLKSAPEVSRLKRRFAIYLAILANKQLPPPASPAFLGQVDKYTTITPEQAADAWRDALLNAWRAKNSKDDTLFDTARSLTAQSMSKHLKAALEAAAVKARQAARQSRRNGKHAGPTLLPLLVCVPWPTQCTPCAGMPLSVAEQIADQTGAQDETAAAAVDDSSAPMAVDEHVLQLPPPAAPESAAQEALLLIQALRRQGSLLRLLSPPSLPSLPWRKLVSRRALFVVAPCWLVCDELVFAGVNNNALEAMWSQCKARVQRTLPVSGLTGCCLLHV